MKLDLEKRTTPRSYIIYPGDFPRSWGEAFKAVFFWLPLLSVLCFLLFGGAIVFLPWGLTEFFGMEPLMQPLGYIGGAVITAGAWYVFLNH